MGSPVQPLLDLRDRLGRASGTFLAGHPIDAVEQALGKDITPTPETPQDTSWHDQMVRQANQSFVDADNARRALQQMHPQHVHTLVQNARAGKYGPDAQKTAQQAMQAATPASSRAGARIARKRSSGQ